LLGGNPEPIDRATAATKPDRAATINIALSASVVFDDLRVLSLVYTTGSTRHSSAPAPSVPHLCKTPEAISRAGSMNQ
jgi:hypothetical protein